MPTQKQHGGKRPNAGRKPTGKTVVTRSVSMPPAVWDAIDRQRGMMSRGKWIAALVARKTKG
jgi:hypothetical protein